MKILAELRRQAGMRLLVVAAAILCACFSLGQDGDLSADTFWSHLAEGLAAKGIQTSGDSETKVHYVFLVDTSQLDIDSPVAGWTQAFIPKLLSHVHLATDNPAGGVDEGKASLVSLFPYQLDLYDKSVQSTDSGERETPFIQAVPLSGDSVKKLIDLVRGPKLYRPSGERYKILNSSRTTFGHDNVGPRSELFKLLGTETDGRPVVVIQITPNLQNEAPGRPEFDAKIRDVDPANGLLKDSGFEKISQADYEVKSDGPTSHAYVWAYAPEKVTGGGKPPVPQPDPCDQDPRAPGCPQDCTTHPDAEGCRPPFPWWILIVAAAIAVATLLWFYMKIGVVIDGQPYVIRRTGSIKVVGGQGGTGTVHRVPDGQMVEQRNGTLALIKFGPLAMSATVIGQGLSVRVGGKTAPSHELRTGRATSVSLVVPDKNSQGGRSVATLSIRADSPKLF